MPNSKTDDYGFTMPPIPEFGYSKAVDATEPDDYGFSRRDKPKAWTRREVSDDATETDTSSGGETEVISADGPKDEKGKPIQTVVGWLVGIKGSSQGLDYRLHSGRNQVGRSPEMDVCLQDNRISRQASLDIYYDPESVRYYIANAGGKCLSYINRKLLMGNEELHPYDRIQLGVDNRGSMEIITELLFVPMCGEHFSWKEINESGSKDEK